jgi:UTP:GlnB (protein PII) uridylyltransferase
MKSATIRFIDQSDGLLCGVEIQARSSVGVLGELGRTLVGLRIHVRSVRSVQRGLDRINLVDLVDSDGRLIKGERRAQLQARLLEALEAAVLTEHGRLDVTNGASIAAPT